MRGSITRTPAAVADVIASKTQRAATGCLIWTGSLTNAGYGRLTWKQPDGHIERGAHRVAYLLHHGSIEPDLWIDHLCRNRACVEPLHLELVTARENTMRSPIALAAVNARKSHCPQGHAYTPDNIYVSRGTGRLCRTCQLARRVASA